MKITVEKQENTLSDKYICRVTSTQMNLVKTCSSKSEMLEWVNKNTEII